MMKNYYKVLESLPCKDVYTKPDLLKNELLLVRKELATTGDAKVLEVYFAPFDYINKDAKIIIVGITPGWTQMEQACRSYLQNVYNGSDQYTALKESKRQASFKGGMRINLVNMLNGLSLNERLGINDCESLFDENNGLVQTTSLIKYPTFINKENYSGSPTPLKVKELMDFIEKDFVDEINQLDSALLIPLGECVTEVLNHLQNRKLIKNHILSHFPHPSNSNGHRRLKYEQHKTDYEDIIKSYAF